MKAKQLAKSRLRRTPDYYYYRGSRATAPVMLLATIVLSIFSMGFGDVKGMIETWNEVAEVQADYQKPVVVQPKNLEMTEKQQIMSYIVEVFGDDADKLITMVSTCENSEFNQEATNWNSNGTFDKGVAQINSIHISGKEFPVCKEAHNSWKANIDCAKAIKDKYGFKAWSCSTKIGVKSFWQ